MKGKCVYAFAIRFQHGKAGFNLETMVDVRQLLKQFGIFVYTGHRVGDAELMEDEIRHLYTSQMISAHDFQKALLIVRAEKSKGSNK